MSLDTETSEASGQQEVGSLFGQSYHAVGKLLNQSLWTFTVAMLLFLWIPLVVMIVLSFAENTVTLFPFEGVTMAHYQEMFRSGILGAAGQSAIIATLSSTLATILGVLASFGLVRFEFRFKELFRVLCILPMLIPGIILGIELLIYFNSLLGLQVGFLTIVLTHSVYGIPFVLLPVTARLYTFDRSLEESAQDLGADAAEAFRDVTLPIIAPAIAAGYLFAWLRSFEDFIRVFFVGGSTSVLTVEMYGLIRFGAGEVLNPASSLIIFVVAVLLAVAMNFGNVVGFVTEG
jgi:ABC-type spermidine/putrescine transport system permease subunit II